jgi:uncharacterized protein YhfF
MTQKIYLTNDQADFWGDFQAETGEPGWPRGIDAFGDSEAMMDELLALVLIGQKRGTACLARWYEDDPNGPPKTGDLWIITDGRNEPVCVTRTTKVEIMPVKDVTAEFAAIEGESDGTYEYWITEHRKFWSREAAREGFEYSDDLDVICEEFELVWQK